MQLSPLIDSGYLNRFKECYTNRMVKLENTVYPHY